MNLFQRMRGRLQLAVSLLIELLVPAKIYKPADLGVELLSSSTKVSFPRPNI